MTETQLNQVYDLKMLAYGYISRVKWYWCSDEPLLVLSISWILHKSITQKLISLTQTIWEYFNSFLDS